MSKYPTIFVLSAIGWFLFMLYDNEVAERLNNDFEFLEFVILQSLIFGVIVMVIAVIINWIKKPKKTPTITYREIGFKYTMKEYQLRRDFTLPQTIIYSISLFFLSLLVFWLFSYSIDRKLRLGNVWGVWMLFILFQTYGQNKIWKQNFELSIKYLKFPILYSLKYLLFRTIRYGSKFLVLLFYFLIIGGIIMFVVLKSMETSTWKPFG